MKRFYQPIRAQHINPSTNHLLKIFPFKTKLTAQAA